MSRTCINVVVYLKDVERDCAMQTSPLELSLGGFRKERQAVGARLVARPAHRGPLTREELDDARTGFHRDGASRSTCSASTGSA